LLDALGHLLRNRAPLVARAFALEPGLLEPVELGLAPLLEGALHHGDDVGIGAAGRERGLRGEETGADRDGGQRDGPGIHLPAPQRLIAGESIGAPFALTPRYVIRAIETSDP